MRIQRVISKKGQRAENEPVDLSHLDNLISKYKNKKGNLIPLLQGTQEIFGYIPHEAFNKIAEETGLKRSDMFGVATFYAQFRLMPVGKHIIKMCHGTACHVLNVTAVTESLLDYLEIKDGETTSDKLFTLEAVACVGCCSLAPVMMIGEETYGKLNPKEALKIVKGIKRNETLENKS